MSEVSESSVVFTHMTPQGAKLEPAPFFRSRFWEDLPTRKQLIEDPKYIEFASKWLRPVESRLTN